MNEYRALQVIELATDRDRATRQCGNCGKLILPFLGVWFSFVALPSSFFVYLVIATLAYLRVVELTKYVFYRYVAGPSSQAMK